METATDFSAVVARARKAFNSGITKDISFRKRQLNALFNMLDENEELIIDALYKDLKRSRFEAYLMDIQAPESEIVTALENIDEWVKPEKVKTDIMSKLSSLYIKKEPLGVCLILGAWNFPFHLVIAPLVAAIAAGNCAVIKPPEVSMHSALLMKKLFEKYLDKNCYPVVIAGPQDSAKLVENHKYDLIFYTGGTFVGKIIMAAAAKTLTPVVLELGGKNPCYIDSNTDLKLAAKRVCFGRFVNAGQICLAPDYILCERETRDKLVEHMKLVLKDFHGQNPKDSKYLARIINDRHFSRIEKLMKSGKTVIGGQTDAEEKYIAPTVLIDVDEDSPAMQEEIFGPVLPIMTVKNKEEAIEFINRREKPLALYIFSRDKQTVQKILDNTSSGGVTINDCLMHHNEFLPFGGVGKSGMGSYHGRYGFETFSHKRSCFEGGIPEMLLDVRYPPYTDGKLKKIKYMKKTPPKEITFAGRIKQLIKLAFIGVLIAYLLQNFVTIA